METDAHGKENMHVIQVPASPNFLKPKPIKLRKKCSKPAATVPLKNVDVNVKKECLGYLIKSPKIPVNPFRRQDNKRKREPESIDDDSNSLLWKRTNMPDNEVLTYPSLIAPHLIDENAMSPFTLPLSQPGQSNECEKIEKAKSKTVPVDWCLKTKIRFTSSLPFPSRTFKTFEEVNGTVGFVRCLHSSETTNKSSDLHSSHGSKFYQRCLVWMHPFLPWLNMFPRSDDKAKNSSTMRLDPSVTESLHLKWCDSFRSLYQQVRLYQCPYFYICSPRFTVLFRCAGAGSIPVIHALISPTTKGFRAALKKEGIEFTMPLCPNKDTNIVELDEFSQSCGLNDSPDDRDADNNEDCVEDEEPDAWLESLGLSQDFPSSNAGKRRDRESRKIDNSPQSMVYVEDLETQALVNFLLNSDICSAKVGPMAGVPPTLLAPTAFLGGTLQPLKISHRTTRKDDKEMQTVEISGPLLPNTIHSLCSLFNTTQEGNFTSVITSHSPTMAFSMFTPQSPMLPCIFAKNNLTDCGLPDEFVQQMCSKSTEKVISNIEAENGLFAYS